MVRVALCICTYARPEGLRNALAHVAELQFDGALRVIVVDNHPAQEGIGVCQSQQRYPHALTWQHEPAAGISAARNAAVRSALTEPVDFIAMIDDDEWPEPGWLAELLACQARSGADIVCGPVEPSFERPLPYWAAGGGLFRHAADPKTGNVLFQARMFSDRDYPWFDPGFGLSGGEDTLFIYGAIDSGAVFARCLRASVYETVPPERLTLRYVAARAFRYGNANARCDRLLRPGIGRSLLRFLAPLAKVGYGLNHLVHSVREAPRIASAVGDLCGALGMWSGQFGYRYVFYGRRGGRNAAKGAPAVIGAPAVRSEPARLTVRCYDNWGASFADALCHLTPRGGGIWGEVAFVRDDARPADWVGIFNGPGPRPVGFDSSPNRLFFAIGEPPIPRYKDFHRGQVPGAYVLTTDESLGHGLNGSRFVLTPCMTRTWSMRRSIEELRRPSMIAKTRVLSWVTSDFSSTPGYRYRLQFLERLRAAVDFDLFGRGFAPIADKWAAIAPYRYSIAFESARADYYFTEKLMDCFVAETFPLYYGSPAIARYFPPESMYILDPEDPDAVEKARAVVNSNLWLERRDAVREAKRRVLEEYNIFARLAKFVLENDRVPEPVQRITVKPV